MTGGAALAAAVLAALLAACSAGATPQSGGGPAGGGRAGGLRPLTAAPPADPHRGSARRPLAGMVVVLDPGHNPGNRHHTAEINRLVDIGNGRKACDTTGTATNGGYAEAAYTLDVVRRARAILAARGARVVLTQNGDRPYGPCVDERARIGNHAHADAAVSVHADGSASGNRGFHVILPAAVHRGIADNRAVVAASRDLGVDLRKRFAAATGTAPADYVAGGTGLDVRADLGGLNLTKVPKVFIECGNMRDPRDAALLTDAAWRQRAALGIADGITEFLTAGPSPDSPGPNP